MPFDFPKLNSSQQWVEFWCLLIFSRSSDCLFSEGVGQLGHIDSFDAGRVEAALHILSVSFFAAFDFAIFK